MATYNFPPTHHYVLPNCYPNCLSMSASAQTSGAGSRSRTQARKKVNDDATYSGPPSTTGGGAKRHATDKPDGEPRVKRKRVEPSYAVSVTNSRKEVTEAEPALSVVSYYICCRMSHTKLIVACRSNSTRCQ